ncbi:MAG: DUF3108 domain-containing protein [Pseudomonadales bacterium]|nr:DUF3108 domain-containing protein [Pseudomonadales bacterium]
MKDIWRILRMYLGGLCLLVFVLSVSAEDRTLSNCATEAQVRSLIKPYEVSYKARFRGFPIDNERVLSVENDGTFRISGDMSLFFVAIHEYSRFQLTPKLLVQPLEYFYVREGLGDSKDFHLMFDWSRFRAENQIPEEPWSIALEPESHDLLTHQLQLRLDLMCKGVQLDRYEYSIIKKKRQRVYAYRPVAEETLVTPVGKLRTLTFEKLEDKPGRKTTVWLAQDWDFLIVRLIYQEKDDASYQITLERGTLADTPITGRP